MLSLKSHYRSISQNQRQYQSNKSNKSEYITPGICDYIPQVYFSKQYFSIYIQSNDVNQVIKFILWNQYYEKTLLKQIFSQLKNENKIGLMQKYEIIASNTSNKSIIYLKISNKVYNLKDKLQYQSISSILKQLKQYKSLTLQKISNQGKWKKILIEFGPYKKKQQFDIIFTTNSLNLSQSRKLIDQQQKINKSQTKQSKNRNKNSVYSSVKKKSGNENFIQKMTKDNNLERDKFSTSKKKLQMSQVKTNSQIKSKKKQSQNTNIVTTIQKNKSNNIQDQIGLSANDFSLQSLDVLKQINLNSTGKLFSNQKNNMDPQGIAPISLDLKRQHKLMAKQNSILEKNNEIGLFSQQLLSKLNQDNKNKGILMQIISKKQEMLYKQKKRVEEVEQTYEKQIQELKMKQLRETQMFKNEISKILQEYSKKYEKQRDENRLLKQEVKKTENQLNDEKVNVSELRVKQKSLRDQLTSIKEEKESTEDGKKKVEKEYHDKRREWEQEREKMGRQLMVARTEREKYLKRYKELERRVKSLVREEETEDD